jgi:hypothetical protein
VSKEQGLLTEIERDLLDGRPLADLLRKCVILGGRAGSEELRDWATQELKGYKNRDDLPSYREVGASIRVDGIVGFNQITGQLIGVNGLPDFTREHISERAPLYSGVGELEALLTNAEAGAVKFLLPGGGDLAAYMTQERDDEFETITAVYWSVSTASIAGCLDQVRTVLAELVAVLRSTVPESQAEPTGAQATNAVNVAVHGRKSRVTVTAAQTAGDGDSTVQAPPTKDEPAWWTLGRKVSAALVGVATVAGAYWAWVAVR